MSTYRKLHGRAIKSVSSNLSAPSAEGQIWFNTTDNKFKSVVASKAFVSSTPYPTAVFGNMGAGTQTAALSFGGTANPSTPSSPLVLTLEYNGSGWSAGGDLSQKRRSGFGFGTQTAALGSTGYTYPETNKTEHYNGTSWTNGGNYPVSQELGGGCGTQTAGLACGGGPGPSPVAISNEYDGSSWTASPGSLNSARKGLTVTGIQTAGLAASAADSPTATACEEYNGSTWTTVNSMNTPRATSSFGSGIQTASILYGTPGSLESYDGTNWTNEPATMGNARNSGASAGTATASLASCGSPGAFTSHVEEYNVSTNIITAAAFSNGGVLPTPIAANQGAGIQTAALSISGQPNSPGTAATAATNHYNGSSWTAGGSLSAGAASYGGVSATKGTETASLYWDGYNPTPSPAGYRATVSSYNGSSWTAQSTFPGSPAGYCGGAGTSTAALSIGGSLVTNCYESDGSYNWTAAGALPAAKYAMAAGGPQTAAIGAGGYGGSPIVLQNTADTYNGTSWTSIGTTPITQASKNGCFGTDSSDFMVAGGPPAKSTCLHYDGTAWATRPSLSTGRHAGSGSGASGTSGLIAGGQTPSFTTATEEFNGETTALNVKTLTQS